MVMPVLAQNSPSLKVTTKLYNDIVMDLNTYENHRTETDYEDSLVTKKFMFSLVNSYAALTYVAFIKSYLGKQTALSTQH